MSSSAQKEFSSFQRGLVLGLAFLYQHMETSFEMLFGLVLVKGRRGRRPILVDVNYALPIVRCSFNVDSVVL